MTRIAAKQAAAVPYRRTAFDTIEVLLVSRRGGGGWGLPKGGIKKGHTAIQTASLESLEEAGILGVVHEESLGCYSTKKQGKRLEVRLFAMRVERMLERWEEEASRVRIWVPIAEAHRLLQNRALERALVRLRHRLIATTQAQVRLAA